MSHTEEIWRRKSDDELLEAVARLDEYTAQGRQVILGEMQRRGLELPAAPQDVETTPTTPPLPPSSPGLHDETVREPDVPPAQNATSKRRRGALSVTLFLLLFIAFFDRDCSPPREQRDPRTQSTTAFDQITCVHNLEVAGSRLVALRSVSGSPFQRWSFIGSPLLDKLSERAYSPGLLPGQIGTSTVLVQEVPTHPRFALYLEGGHLYSNPLQSFYRFLGIGPGSVFFIMPVRILERAADLAAAQVAGRQKLFHLDVDNSLDYQVRVQLDDYDPISVPERSQLRLWFTERSYREVRTKSPDGVAVDSFTVFCPQAEEDVEYVYNVAAHNRYLVQLAVYRR